jgi:signal transduction histidine kinase
MKRAGIAFFFLTLSWVVCLSQSVSLPSVFKDSNPYIFSEYYNTTQTIAEGQIQSLEELLKLALLHKDNAQIYNYACQQGFNNLLMGDLIQAIKNYQLASQYSGNPHERYFSDSHLAFVNDISGRDQQALEIYLRLIKNSDDVSGNHVSVYLNGLAGIILLQQSDSVQAWALIKKSVEGLSKFKLKEQKASLYERMGDVYLYQKKFSAAAQCYEDQLKEARNLNKPLVLAHAYRNLGLCGMKKGDYDKAEVYFQKSLAIKNDVMVSKLLKDTYLKIVTVSSFNKDFEKADRYHELYRQMKSNETVINETAEQKNERDKIIRLLSQYGDNGVLSKQNYELSQQLTELDIERQNKEKALEELTLAEAQKKVKELELERVASEKLKKEAELAKKELQLTKQKEFRNIMLLIFGIVVIGIIFLFNRYLYKKRSLEELNKAHEQLRQAHEQLKQTQEQLIQSEKMASLGQLTAGIAHEIQNPLNFVNNFSSLSVDLINDYIHEKDENLLDEIKTNLQRINHHGGRVSAIVKGMLMHSRNKTTDKEETNLNQLVEESLMLAYHGKKSSETDFHCHIEKSFDPNVPAIKVAVQDIRRVIINLINNAFYAVHERDQSSKTLKQAINYKPHLRVSTQMVNNMILIEIEDNGSGIPDEIKEKIFNPFFTSKPTGKGTGLGLSISFDIIEKQHQGKISFESQKDLGTVFRILLPLNLTYEQKSSSENAEKSMA